jgi:excisionase family DNA binding protein
MSDPAELTHAELLEAIRETMLKVMALPQSPWMSPLEAARYIGISIGTLRNWSSGRFIPFVKRGGVIRYNRNSIDKWLSKGGCPGRTTLADNAK